MFQSIPKSKYVQKCDVCKVMTNIPMNVHRFLRHTDHTAVYMCEWCTYSDLVTDRFQQHAALVHGRRDFDVEGCFRACAKFRELQECSWDECDFITNTYPRLNFHMYLMHSPRGAARSPARVATVRVDELDEAVAAGLVVQQRRDMAEQSMFRKVEERRHGLRSPPLTLMLEAAAEEPTARGATANDNQPDDERQRRVVGFGRGKVQYADSPVVSPQRPGTEDEQSEDSGDVHVVLSPQEARAQMAARDEQVFERVRQLPRPPRVGRAMYLPAERAAAKRPLARYLARMDHTHRPMFLFFFELMQPMTGAVVKRPTEENNYTPVMAGAAVTRHAGAPELRGRSQPSQIPWKVMGELVDTYSRPWMIVRRVQLSAFIPEGLYQLVDAHRRLIYEVEVMFLD